MAGSCRRLLACFSLVFSSAIFFLPTFFSAIGFSPVSSSRSFAAGALYAQDAERLPEGRRVIVPNLPPKLLPGFDPPLDEPFLFPPARIPDPVLPRRYPVVPENPGLPVDVFQQLVRKAGIIFSGRVTLVGITALLPSRDHAIAITFQVEHAMRGTLPNQPVTIHEWAGLWDRGERYRVGEHVLLFLYAPSTLGLSSPVAGNMGRFALDSKDRIVMNPTHIASFAGNPILHGRSLVPFVDFALAVRNAQNRGLIEP